MRFEETTRWAPASVRTVDIEGRLARTLKPDTLAHVYRTAEMARMLAERLGVDPDKAELAALLHRVAAGHSDRDLLRLAEYYEVPVSPIEARVPHLLHGKIGAEILHEKWGITDDELLSAVRNYVAGGPRMSQLDKILFLADKLEPERDRFYGDLDPVRELAMTDPDAAIGKLSAWMATELPAADWRPDAVSTTQSEVFEMTRATWPR
jgi:predicted HD superfamily hydrolase involved in NAD metabolism